MTVERNRQGEFVIWLGLACNAALAVMKAVIGILGNSKALIADAVNSASDVFGSIAVLIGLKASRKPPDEDHPYGHGKAESIAAIIVSVLLMVVGLEIGLSGVRSIFAGIDEPPGWIALVALIISIVVKEAMFRIQFRIGKKTNSLAIIASSWDHRSDVFASVAALVGVGGAMLGGRLQMEWLYYLDPAAAIFVSLLVIRVGYKQVMNAIHSAIDHVMHEEDAAEIVQAAGQVPGVLAVDELRARELGPYVIVDVKISVDPCITVQEGHSIAKRVKQKLIGEFDHVFDVFVHVNPYDPVFPYGRGAGYPGDRPTILH
jgi:cation diffusion facilitator family transporter